MKEYENAISLLKKEKEVLSGMFENYGGKVTDRMTEDIEEDIKAIERAINILEYENEHQEDQEAHSAVTIEMEMGREIPLGEWARINGLDSAYARKKAKRGSLKTAHKIGRDWFIRADEKNKDNRRRVEKKMIKEISKKKFEEKFTEVSTYGLEKNMPVYLENGMILIDEEWNGEVYTVKENGGERIFRPWYKKDEEGDMEIIGYTEE